MLTLMCTTRHVFLCKQNMTFLNDKNNTKSHYLYLSQYVEHHITF